MWKNDNLTDIQNQIFQYRLGKALAMTENYLLTYPQQYDRGELLDLKTNYQLMTDYWQKGLDDPKRNDLYGKLLRRLNMFVSNLSIQDRIAHTPILQSCHQHASIIRNDSSEASVRHELEDFVTNLAMLELEPPHVRGKKVIELYQKHQDYMSQLFNFIVTSDSWPDWQTNAFIDILLSPTIDVSDQQLVVSAVMLSAMNVFDIGKFRLLTTVYEKSTEELLRQRALVGWVFCLNVAQTQFYDEVGETVKHLCSNKRCQKELTELQMQIVYCMLADNDSQKIKDEIMPELMKGNHLKMTRQGIVETEEDQLEEILHPESAERDMERMEVSMQKMADMQRKGSDIYFAGFSQMKRFPFFYKLSNWFVPFYPQHPEVSAIWNNSKGNKFLKVITHVGAFCDSDKYSFVLAFDQVLSHLPEKMLEMIEKGEASPMAVGGEVPMEQQLQPAFMRRMYLQNLYRFFRLYSYRSDFNNPFESHEAVFFANSIFQHTELELSFTEVASFLVKQGMTDEVLRVLQNQTDWSRDLQYYLIMGHLQLSNKVSLEGSSAIESFREALKIDPSSMQAMKGYARALFNSQRYAEALALFQKLQGIVHESRSLDLNVAICMANVGNYEQALQLLYKLNYEKPDDLSVKRVLAWCLTLASKYSQAVKMYEQIVSSEHPSGNDWLNYAYCMWFSRDIKKAESLFRQYMEAVPEGNCALEQEFTQVEHKILVEHGLTDVDIQLMLDVLGA